MKRIVKSAFALSATILAALPVAAQSVYPGQHAGKLAVETAVPLRAEAFDLRDVRLLPGRVHDNLSRDSAWMACISVNRLVHSFRNNAGVFAGLEGGYESVRKYGGWESLDCDLRGHTTGHLLSAYGLMYAATGDTLMRHKGDSIVAALGQVQRALGDSGYLSAFPEELINRNVRGQGVWAPWYTLHKILAGLIDQYLYADNEEALDIARRMAGWAYNKVMPLDDTTRRRMLRNEFGGINDAFYNLYAITADRRHLELARWFYHNDVIDPLKAGNRDMGTRHTNTFIPKVIAEIRNYELTGDTASLRAADVFYDAMLRDHIFATGSLSQKEHFFAPSEFTKHINGYTGETCCSYNMLKLSRHMYALDASPRVADYYERTLFNHILAQQDPESGMVCYFLPLLSGAYKVYSTPEQSFWCCVGSGFESHAKYAEAIYAHAADTLMVNLFIPSRLDWRDKGMTVTQLTDFPRSETTTLRIDSARGDWAVIALRYPSWSGKPTVRVNGRTVKTAARGGYICLHRKWRAGDRIEVTYPMSLHLACAPDNSSRAAVMYGPIVLAGLAGTEGMTGTAPFSDPTVRNDYYTYDYHVPANLKTTLRLDPAGLSATIRRAGDDLRFLTAEGETLVPLYEANRCRYVVYWNIEN